MTDGEPKHTTKFGSYLRYGSTLSPVEVKFNPYHDPYNGQFTFAPGGPARRASIPRRQREPVAGRTVYPKTDARHAGNFSTYQVQAGDTLMTLAKRRKGLTVDGLKWLNDMKGEALRIGQSIKIPHQAFLEAGRDARNRLLALDYYMQTHGGRLPPNVAHPPSLETQLADPANWRRIRANGYAFDLDTLNRTQRVTGVLASNPSQKRSRAVQRAAGGRDRLPGDQGGHYIARRFDGPRKAFNHFAQDGNFNKSEYLRLENSWAAAQKLGKKVYVRIIPKYKELSSRPHAIEVFYTIDSIERKIVFQNRKGGK